MSYSDLLTELWQCREQKRQLAAQEKELNERYKTLETALIRDLNNDGSGLNSVKNDIARATLTRITIVQTEDKPTFIDYIFETNQRHLATINPASAPCKEAIDTLQIEIPGIRLVTLPTLQLRTIKAPV